MSSGKPPLTGGCQCGGVRYEIAGAPMDIYICHCAECRRQSASAFGISVIVAPGDLTRLAGEPKCWTRAAAVQGTLNCYFCPDCGTRLWHGDPARDPVISIKGGSLDSPPDLTHAKHIWTRRALPGVVIPDHVERHAEEPPAGA